MAAKIESRRIYFYAGVKYQCYQIHLGRQWIRVWHHYEDLQGLTPITPELEAKLETLAARELKLQRILHA